MREKIQSMIDERLRKIRRLNLEIDDLEKELKEDYPKWMEE